MKTDLKIKDASGNIVFLEIEITHRNKYAELTICGELSGGHGQITFEPVTELQEQLKQLWDNKHLNKVSKKEQKEIEVLIEALKNEYNEQVGEMEISEIEENEAIEMIKDKNFSEPEKVLALLLEEGATVGEIDNVTEEGGNCLSFGGRDYLVCTDDEADQEQDEEFENYLDECILPDLPANLRNYFDSEAWKQDAKKDGRGHSLGRYDGNECEQKINGTMYFLYRQ